MKRRNFNGFFSGMLTMLLIVAMVGSASATTGKVTKEIEYKNIAVSLDGKKLDLKDTKGNAVEPFMFNGTNYIPARALAEALGMSVSWDSATNTVVLTTSGSTAPGTAKENSKMVDITLPSSVFQNQDMSKFDADAYAKEEKFEKAVINQDGSITITMTQERYQELKDDIIQKTEKGFNDMIGSKDTPYIKNITHTDNFETITISVDKSGYTAAGVQASFVPYSVYLQAAIYQAFIGNTLHTEIQIVDAATGNVLKSASYPTTSNS